MGFYIRRRRPPGDGAGALSKHERPGSPQRIAVQPLPNALLRVEQAKHVTTTNGMSAEVPRPPENGDGALAEAKAQFGAGRGGNALPDNHGVEGVAHEGVACELRESYHEPGAGYEPHPHELTRPRSPASLQGCTGNGDRDRSTPAMRCASLPTQQRADHHPAIHGYESSPDAPPSLPIRRRSIWGGCSPWFRPIRSDGSQGRMLGCRVP